LSSHTPEADSYSEGTDSQTTCQRCGKTITYTVVSGPGDATNSCGCSVQTELMADRGEN